jgi:uncharacterized protein YbjQ (UPF0145 family)
MERVTEELVFEYDGLASLLPMDTLNTKFVREGYKIVSKETVAGKHVHLKVFKQVKELIA